MDDREASGRFLLLVEEYRLAGWVGLGKLRDPGGGEVRRDLGLARHAIDTLGMLEVKTRGNRSDDEERLLRQVLADLRINFVDELKREEEEKAAAGAEAPGGEPAAVDGSPPPGGGPASGGAGG